MLYLYNSLTRQKELFTPRVPGKAGMYVCGITVYDRCHLGHARSMVSFDVIVRFLRALEYEVTYVRNITDIDDKIIARANEKGISIEELTTTYIEEMYQDADALGILRPDVEPRATQHIDSIIALIQKLIDKGYAYVGESHDVYYRVQQFNEYGKLSRKDPAGLINGVRVEVADDKDSPLDFVLWKHAKPHEPSWSSPWGNGRPGWHIECSAMAMCELGEQFDIHGGGLDLQFPHHENEIAQSEAATDKPFANYWMHVGLLQINHEKMSKSLNNFFTIKDVLAKHHPEVVRYFLLSSHYRSPLNYSTDTIELANKSLTRLYQSLKEIDVKPCEIDTVWQQQFYDAMNDDFNTPVALSVLFQLSHEVNKTKSVALAYTLYALASILGLLQTEPQIFLQSGHSEMDIEEINRLVAERTAARAAKDWAKADEIRQLLLSKQIEIEDGAEGSTWRSVVS